MSDWGSEIGAWTEKLIRAWESGDMQRFRELAKGLDDVWSDRAMDAHAGELAGLLGKAVAAGIDGTVRTLGLIDFGFGPQSADALDFAKGRKEVASLLDSKGWQTVPYQLRDRAFFSSRVNDLKTLQEMKSRIEKAQEWDGGAPVMDSGLFAKEMRAILLNGGVRTAGAEHLGGLRDILSTRRLELVYRTQTEMARGWAGLKAGMDPDILDAVPGLLFTRIMPKRNPRPDAWWDARWAQACAAANFEGCLLSPKIGLKTSRVWQALGDLGPFGNPFAPFEYGSGMGAEDADRDTCEAAGLLERNEPVEPAPVPDLDARMEEGVDGVKPELLDRLDLYFGDQVSVDGAKAVWRKPDTPYLSAAEQGWESSAAWLADAPERILEAGAAREALQRGVAVADAGGRPVLFSKATLGHIAKDPNRLKYLADAVETVKNPQEVVIQDRQRGYFRAVEENGSRRYMTVFVATEDVKDTPAGEVRTYYRGKTPGTIDGARRGTGRIAYRD